MRTKTTWIQRSAWPATPIITPRGRARTTAACLRIGAVMMPVGFLLAGMWHPEGDPGPAIWIVPPGALLVIFGVVALALVRNRER